MDINAELARLQNEKARPVVFVCGLAGSGKTTFARKLASEQLNAKLVELDWYATYPTEQRKERIRNALASKDPKKIEQEENPQNWYSWDLFEKDLRQLQQTGKISVNQAWNQKTGEKDLNISLDFVSAEKGLIICEGMYLVHPEIAKFADFIIYLNVSKEEAAQRTANRDGHRSSPEYLAFKEALAEKYDIPYFEKYKNSANLIV